MTGADVLTVLTKRGLSTAREIARAAAPGIGDGRHVARILTRLVRAGLVEWTTYPRDDRAFYKATDRGRQVDGILDRIVAARGGSFEPWSQNGITSSEAYALR